MAGKKGNDYSLSEGVGTLLQPDDPKLISDQQRTWQFLKVADLPEDDRAMLADMIGLQDYV